MATPAPPHAVPAGPLAVRWLSYDLPPQRAGALSVGRLQLQNAGTAAWRSRPGTDIHLSYHWLDPRGNPIVWAGHFILLPERVRPQEEVDVYVTMRAPRPPGAYRLAFDLVNEGRYWFRELGNERLELDMLVRPRLAARTLAVDVAPVTPALEALTRAALDRLDEPLADEGAEARAYLLAGCRPAADWSRRLLDAHEEGFAAVAGSITVDGGPLERRRAARDLAAWRPGFGRAPDWSRPLLCPSLVVSDVQARPAPGPAGLPALDPEALDEPVLCDGRIRVSADARALRPAGRRRA